jgi:tRNA(Arg) A34 adenosine deaminase TadA
MADTVVAVRKSLVGVKGDALKIDTVLGTWAGSDVLLQAELPLNYLKPEERERHLLYAQLVMSLVYSYWNGYKKGPGGTYRYRDVQLGEKNYETYMGHNIAAIAVDGKGEIVDFDFNHNEVLRSSIEHAEARLMRRLFNLANIHVTWNLASSTPDPNAGVYTSLLANTTVYTTAEPCAQCIGIMALARVKEVVYIQADDGTMRVANALYNLMPYGTQVLPIAADRLGIPYGTELTNRFGQFAENLTKEPFWELKDASGTVIKKDDFPSLVSFLCTDKAREVFATAYKDLDDLIAKQRQLLHPKYPDPQSLAEGEVRRLTNEEVLNEVAAFRNYAVNLKQRGTSH